MTNGMSTTILRSQQCFSVLISLLHAQQDRLLVLVVIGALMVGPKEYNRM
jgi:hypothetical protein